METREKEKVLTSLLRSLETSKSLIHEDDENYTFRCVFAYAAGYLKNSKIPYKNVYEFLFGYIAGWFKGNLTTVSKAEKPAKKYIVHAKSVPCDEEPEIGKDFTKEFDDFWTANAYMEELDNETYLNGCHVYCQTYIEEKAVEQ